MSIIRGTTITTPLARTAVPDDSAVSKKPWSSKNTVDKLCPYFTESGDLVVCEPLEGYPLTVISYIGQDGASKITLRQDTEEESRVYTVDLPYDISDASYNWTTGTLYPTDDDEIQLTPQVITALYGENTFYSDCGDTTVSGKADPNKYWAEKLAEQEAINEELTAEVEALQAEQNKQYELIEEVTLTEAVASFTRNKDTNGVAYNFSAVRACANFPAASASQTITFILGAQGSDYYIYHNDEGIATDARQTILVARNDCGICDYYYCVSQTGYRGYLRTRSTYIQNVWKNIKKVTINAATTFPIGTVIKIYGIRG